MNVFRILLFVISVEIFVLPLQGNNDVSHSVSLNAGWVDSLMKSMTLDEKIAQLIFIRAYSNKDADYNAKISKLVADYHVGGITFFQGGPLRQAVLTNTWQAKSKIPLFISIDGEWGLGMRLDSLPSFPKQMTLGAIADDKLIYDMASLIARDFRNMGIHINFAPVVDINTNPQNPVINMRSFGEDKENVAAKGLAYMRGLQLNGIMATAKHFPGHGDTDKDSHYTLPVIKHPFERIKNTELYPFKILIDNGLMAVMTAHLNIPAIDNTKDQASSLSKQVVTAVLKEQLGFRGLTFTDALEMKGITSYNEPGDAEVKALLAGNDILLLPQDVTITISAVKKAINKGIIKEEDINSKCRKVLEYKFKFGLNYYRPVKTDGLYEKLADKLHELTISKLYAAAITLIKNDGPLLPLNGLDTLRIASVVIGDTEMNVFQASLLNYHKFDCYSLPQTPSFVQINAMLQKMKPYNLVIVSIHKTTESVKYNYGISQTAIDFIELLGQKKQIIVDVFGNPYSLGRFNKLSGIEAIVMSYEDNIFTQKASAEVIFGGSNASGTLPVSASDVFPVKTGIKTLKTRLRYGAPEEVGISSSFLVKVDSLALQGISGQAYPGCQVLVAKDGVVIYSKSFGFHTYDNKLPVANDDLYDVASLTKIAATTLAVMRLSDKGLIDIDQTLVRYLPEARGTDKENLVLRDILAHQARLVPWIPYYLETVKKGKQDTSIYSATQTALFNIKVADDLYIRNNYLDTIYKRIFDSKLLSRTKYRYSDVGFYLLQMIIERTTKESFEKYLFKEFYHPLGLHHTLFNPLQYTNKSKIIPTEFDTVFRMQLVHGYVHDPGAAMMGGVAGHAGLFMNSCDLAVLMQMLLQNGSYGGKDYINPATIKEFTKQQFPLNDNRRGLGFDKPTPGNPSDGVTSRNASMRSFGHSGFTGTYVWVDPDYNLIYVFLSNRVHPDSENKNIYLLNTRTEILQAIYDAIAKSKI